MSQFRFESQTNNGDGSDTRAYSSSTTNKSGTEATGINLLDLNDDCLYNILSLKSITKIDLCSIARTSSRLKDIANVMFLKRYNKCNLKLRDNKITEAKRVIVVFGSLISELSISKHTMKWKHEYGILDLVINFCSSKLMSLRLYTYYVPRILMVKLATICNSLHKLSIERCTIEGANIDLFDKCESLFELKITGEKDDSTFFLGNFFPKLERFTFSSQRLDSNIEAFISRHTNLKMLNVWSYSDCTFLLPVIAESCEQLEELRVGSHRVDLVRYNNTLCGLLTLQNLRKLRVDCSAQSVTKFIKELSSLKSLVHLELVYIRGDPQLLQALSQLKLLQTLRFTYSHCDNYQNVNQLRELAQLKELRIAMNLGNVFEGGVFPEYIDLNVVRLIEHLTKLNSLELLISSIVLDNTGYLKILDLVQNRPNNQQVLELKCFTADDVLDDVVHRNRQIIKLTKSMVYRR